MPGRPTKPFWNSTSQRWEMRGKQGLVFSYGDGGITTALTASLANLSAVVATIANLQVGSTLILESLEVTGVGTIEDLNVGTLAIIQAIDVAGIGSIGVLDVGGDAAVGSLVSGNTLNITGVGSMGAARLAQLQVGAGGVFTRSFVVVGSSAAITSVGSGDGAVASIAIADVAVGDAVTAVPVSVLPHAQVVIGQAYVSGGGNVSVPVHQDATTEGSFAARGWTVKGFR